jgi:hypothetical protein
VIANIVFYIIYELFLSSWFLRLVSNKEDVSDRNYYEGIFNNFNIAVIAVTIVLFLLLLFYKYLKSISNQPVNKVLIFCVLANIVIQLFLITFISTIPISDSKYYIEHANMLYETGSYVNQFGNFSAFWIVGLPAYLVLLRKLGIDFMLAAKLINVILSTGLIICCYFIFKNYLSNKALNLFLIIFTLFPSNLFSVNIILTDYPFTTLLWLSILILFSLVKKPSFLLTLILGVSLALAAYLRPIAIFIIIIFSIIVVIKNYPAGFKYSALLMAVFFLIHLPWGIRNFSLFNSIVPVSTNGGYIFLMGNHENSTGGVNFNFRYDLSNPDEVSESSNAYSAGLNAVISHPVKSVLRLPIKLLHTYYRGDSSITWSLKKTGRDVPDTLKSIIFFSTNLMFYVLILMNIYVLLAKWRKISFRKYSEIITVAVYLILIIVIYVGSERYHIPLLPVHIFLAAKYFEL